MTIFPQSYLWNSTFHHSRRHAISLSRSLDLSPDRVNLSLLISLLTVSSATISLATVSRDRLSRLLYWFAISTTSSIYAFCFCIWFSLLVAISTIYSSRYCYILWIYIKALYFLDYWKLKSPLLFILGVLRFVADHVQCEITGKFYFIYWKYLLWNFSS